MKPAASIKNTLSTWESSHRGFPFDRSIVERMSWPKQSTTVVAHAAAGILTHDRRRITRRIERQRHEPYPVVQHGGVLDRLLHRVEDAIRKRTAVRIDARGVDEPE